MPIDPDPLLLPRDASVGYCLSVPVPFVAAPLVLVSRGAGLGAALAGGALIAIAGLFIGALAGLVVLRASRAVRNRLGAVALTLAGTIAALVIAFLVPLS